MAGWDDIPNDTTENGWDSIPDEAIATPAQPSFMDKVKEWAGQSTPIGGGDMPMGLDPMANKQGQLGMAQQALTPAAQGAWQSSQNIGQVLPVADMAANLITSLYGVPISGLAGIAGLAASGGEGGLDRANQWLNATQNALVYKPQTPGGQQLTEAAGAPLEPFRQVGAAAGGKLEEMGYPMAGAAVHSAIEASPLLLARRGASSKSKISNIDNQISQTIRQGVNKAVRPTIVGKSDINLIEKQYKNYETAFPDMVKANPELNSPNMMEVSQANMNTKIKLWNESHDMAVSAGFKGAEPSLLPAAAEIRSIVKEFTENPSLKPLHEDMYKHLDALATDWETKFQKTNPVQLELLLKQLNEESLGYWRDPKPGSPTMGAIMERVAQVVRKEQEKYISQFEGPGYLDIRKRLGAQMAIEKELANRALVDARKAPSGFFDILTAPTAAHFVGGLLTHNPVSMVQSAVLQAAKMKLKARNDPNLIIGRTWDKTKELMVQKEAMTPKIPLTPIVGDISTPPLGPKGKPYKPPTIRATLVPKPIKKPEPVVKPWEQMQPLQAPSPNIIQQYMNKIQQVK